MKLFTTQAKQFYNVQLNNSAQVGAPNAPIVQLNYTNQYYLPTTFTVTNKTGFQLLAQPPVNYYPITAISALVGMHFVGQPASITHMPPPAGLVNYLAIYISPSPSGPAISLAEQI
jgi:hypothetical protein